MPRRSTLESTELVVLQRVRSSGIAQAFESLLADYFLFDRCEEPGLGRQCFVRCLTAVLGITSLVQLVGLRFNRSAEGRYPQRTY